MSEDHTITFIGHEPLENKVLRVRCACGWTSKVAFGRHFLYQGITEARQGLTLSHEKHIAEGISHAIRGV